MTDITALELSQASNLCLDRLLKVGISVEQCTDFQQIRQDAEYLKKPYFTKQLSSDFNDFTLNNAFWLRIFHSESIGKKSLIGLVGARKDIIEVGEFSGLLERQMNRLYGDGSESPLLSKTNPPVFDNIYGNVVYIGDLYIVEEHRGRDKIDKRALLVLLFILAQMRWSFDWLYAFVRKEHGERGYLVTYGFTRIYLAALLWKSPPPERDDSDQLACIDKDDLSYLVRRMLDVPHIF